MIYCLLEVSASEMKKRERAVVVLGCGKRCGACGKVQCFNENLYAAREQTRQGRPWYVGNMR